MIAGMRGALLCLLSAAAFGTLGIFGKLASDAGANMATTLLVRFALAGAGVRRRAARDRPLGALRRLPRRVVLTGLGLGAFGYSLQSGLFFAAIDRLDVSMVALHPLHVPGVRDRRGHRARPRRAVAADRGGAERGLGRLVLVLLAGGSGGFELVGALLALGASLTYTTYILVSDRSSARSSRSRSRSLVLTGATASFAVVGLATGSLDLALSGEAWLWLILIALVSTVVAVSAFFAGLRRVGPSEAAILSTFEPPVTVVLAFLVLGERLTAPQLAGGALVLAAVVLLQLRSTPRTRSAVTDSAANSTTHQVAPAVDIGRRVDARWERGDDVVALVAGQRGGDLGHLVRVLEVDREEALVAGGPAQRPGLAVEARHPDRQPDAAPAAAGTRMPSTRVVLAAMPAPSSPDQAAVEDRRAPHRASRRACGRRAPRRSSSSSLPNSSLPSPTPSVSRPLLSRSRVAVSRATLAGRRRASGVTIGPSRMPLRGGGHRGQRDLRVGDLAARARASARGPRRTRRPSRPPRPRRPGAAASAGSASSSKSGK